MKRVIVAAGVIVRDDKVFLALRKPDQHQGNLWEFPGGKCEADELPEHALSRELQEECGIKVTNCSLLETISHDYADKHVALHFFKVTGFEGEPVGKEGQSVAWVPFSELGDYQFPEANQAIVDKLLKHA